MTLYGKADGGFHLDFLVWCLCMYVGRKSERLCVPMRSSLSLHVDMRTRVLLNFSWMSRVRITSLRSMLVFRQACVHELLWGDGIEFNNLLIGPMFVASRLNIALQRCVKQ